jgi:hypothetical protein
MTDPAFDVWFAQARAVPLEQIIQQRNIKLKRQGVELIGPCPKCGGEDRFGVNLREQLYNCRKCGAGGHGGIDLVAWLDGTEPIPAAEYLNGEPPPKANGKDHTPEPRKVGAARFLYPDENGETLFGVSRVEFQNPDGSFVLKDGKRKKTFSQWRPDPNNTGKWLPGVEGVRVIPYRLPELIEAIGNGYTVLIVEGEGKVDLLRKWNVPATCCSQGAGKWKSEHSEFFRGAEVAILPDNDAAGREHADVVGKSLQGIAATVHVLELPGLPPKGDILDWIKAGGTREKLDELLRQARPWAPRDHPQQVNGDDDEALDDLGERDARSRPWCLGSRLRRGMGSRRRRSTWPSPRSTTAWRTGSATPLLIEPAIGRRGRRCKSIVRIARRRNAARSFERGSRTASYSNRTMTIRSSAKSARDCGSILQRGRHDVAP